MIPLALMFIFYELPKKIFRLLKIIFDKVKELLSFIFISIPKKVFSLIKFIYEKMKWILTLIFIKIPKYIWSIIQKIVEVFKVLFIPDYKKNKAIKKSKVNKQPIKTKTSIKKK